MYNGGELPDSGAAPGELSLSLTDDLTEMRVSWATMDQVVENARVVLDAPCPAGGCTFAADTRTYSVLQKWWPTFNGSLHTAVITGLEPGARYTYRVGSDSPGPNTTAGEGAFSEPYSFASPVAAGAPTNVAVLADMGTVMPLGFAVAEKLAAVQDSLGVDTAMVVGDLAYAGIDTAFPRINVSKDDEFEWIWDLWQIQNQPVAATRPWMVGIGNHEAWYNWTAVTSRFHMPNGPTVGAVPPFWWSMDTGLAHFSHLCTEFDMNPGSPQLDWFAADLAAAASPAARAVTPWIVVTLHRPPYSSDQSWENLRADIEPLLAQHQVDLVVSGHMHAFERTHAVGANGASVVTPSRTDGKGNNVYDAPGFPVYITQGNSGAAQGESWQRPAPAWSAVRWANGWDSSPPRASASDAREEAPAAAPPSAGGPGPGPYEATYTDSFGFGLARFMNATHMSYESIPITGVFTDTFWIVKPISGAQ